MIPVGLLATAFRPGVRLFQLFPVFGIGIAISGLVVSWAFGIEVMEDDTEDTDDEENGYVLGIVGVAVIFTLVTVVSLASNRPVVPELSGTQATAAVGLFCIIIMLALIAVSESQNGSKPDEWDPEYDEFNHGDS